VYRPERLLSANDFFIIIFFNDVHVLDVMLYASAMPMMYIFSRISLSELMFLLMIFFAYLCKKLSVGVH
jgi:hypothetical protein